MADNDVNGVLEDLIQTLEDGKKGFTETAEKLANADRGDLAAPMLEYASQRAEFSSELRSLATTQGIRIEESGSIAGGLHRGWMSLKDALSSDEAEAVLKAAETGEDHAKREFEKALDADLPEDVRVVVARQASAVTAAHDAVRTLRDREAA